MKKRILTGDRPTSRLHIGHFAGSLENRVRLQDTHDQFLIIADVQALTTHGEHPEILKKNVMDVCIDYLSVGIDPEKTSVFVQSLVPQIAELTIFYSMFVSVNLLRHNPTIKTEAAQYGYKDMTYGFLGYPVSQAADITFCGADLVPVGEDQLPVVEVTRKIVRKFNALYQPVLREPETLLGSCPRLVGLDGSAKMSKSMGNAIYLSDTEEIIRQRVATALTDPARIRKTDPGHPEVCVVSSYHSVFNGAEHEDICSRCRAGTVGCTACKAHLADVLNQRLAPFRERRASLEANPGHVREILQAGSERARREGEKTMQAVREAMSMDYF